MKNLVRVTSLVSCLIVLFMFSFVTSASAHAATGPTSFTHAYPLSFAKEIEQRSQQFTWSNAYQADCSVDTSYPQQFVHIKEYAHSDFCYARPGYIAVNIYNVYAFYTGNNAPVEIGYLYGNNYYCAADGMNYSQFNLSNTVRVIDLWIGSVPC